VHSTTTAKPPITPPLNPCPTVEVQPVTAEPQEYNVSNSSTIQCSDVFTAQDGFNIIFNVSVSIGGTDAVLRIINARTGSTISSFANTTEAVVYTNVTQAQIFYSANWLSSIEFDISYYSVNGSNPCDKPGICGRGTCAVNPNTGGELCLCPACDTGDHCETETDPCLTATAKRKCRVDQTTAPGNCSIDDSITDYCAYKCNCTYPVDGVTNQCA
ncbi:hypothetical protein OSTOST_03967, partial [Ostertagia ostertagi]